MRLNLGCGPVRKEGFVNIDINPQVNPDLVLDLNRLPYPFEPDSVDYIYGAQLVEHLHVHCIDFFRECHRVLKADGVLEMHLPNMFSLKARLLYLFGRIEASPCWNPYHFKLVHPSYLLKLLRHLGFEARLYHRRCATFPFDYLFSDSLWIKARKRR